MTVSWVKLTVFELVSIFIVKDLHSFIAVGLLALLIFLDASNWSAAQGCVCIFGSAAVAGLQASMIDTLRICCGGSSTCPPRSLSLGARLRLAGVVLVMVVSTWLGSFDGPLQALSDLDVTESENAGSIFLVYYPIFATITVFSNNSDVATSCLLILMLILTHEKQNYPFDSFIITSALSSSHAAIISIIAPPDRSSDAQIPPTIWVILRTPYTLISFSNRGVLALFGTAAAAGAIYFEGTRSQSEMMTHSPPSPARTPLPITPTLPVLLISVILIAVGAVWNCRKKAAPVQFGSQARAQPQPGPFNSPQPGPLNSPVHSQVEGPLNSPVHSQVEGPLNSPQPGPLNSPQPGPLNSPQPGPLPSPEPGSLNSPELGPLNSLQPGPLNSPEPGPGPLHSPEPNPLDPQTGPLRSPGPGPLNSLQPELGPLHSPQPGPLNSPQPGPLNSLELGPLNSREPGPLNSLQLEPGPLHSPEPDSLNSLQPEPGPGPLHSPQPGPGPLHSPQPGPGPLHSPQPAGPLHSRQLGPSFISPQLGALNSLRPPRKGDEELDVNNVSIDLKMVLGKGHFGVVYLGMIGFTKVAVKMMLKLDDQSANAFEKEIRAMAPVPKHNNVAQLLGVVEIDGKKGVVMKYYLGGSLGDALTKWREEKLTPTPSKILLILLNIVNGLKHLHQLNLVHRDLAARNILFGDTTCDLAVIADFGLTRQAEYKMESAGALPLGWLPPETILYGRSIPKSDVWSFGVLIWEVLTQGEKPLNNESVSEITEAARDDSLRNILLQTLGTIPNRNEFNDQLVTLVKTCLIHDPADRPSIFQVEVILSDLRRNTSL